MRDETKGKPTSPKDPCAEASTVGVGVGQTGRAEEPGRFDRPSRWESVGVGETGCPLVTAVTAQKSPRHMSHL